MTLVSKTKARKRTFNETALKNETNNNKSNNKIRKICNDEKNTQINKAKKQKKQNNFEKLCKPKWNKIMTKRVIHITQKKFVKNYGFMYLCQIEGEKCLKWKHHVEIEKVALPLMKKIKCTRSLKQDSLKPKNNNNKQKVIKKQPFKQKIKPKQNERKQVTTTPSRKFRIFQQHINSQKTKKDEMERHLKELLQL